MEPQINTNTGGIEGSATSPGAGHGMGALVGALIVLAVLVLGGVYFLSSKTAVESRYEPPVILGDPNADTSLPPTSSSDNVEDISADIDATNLGEFESQIDADLKTVEENL